MSRMPSVPSKLDDLKPRTNQVHGVLVGWRRCRRPAKVVPTPAARDRMRNDPRLCLRDRRRSAPDSWTPYAPQTVDVGVQYVAQKRHGGTQLRYQWHVGVACARDDNVGVEYAAIHEMKLMPFRKSKLLVDLDRS